MKEKQWVQHISGQGEKWEVTREWPEGWHARGSHHGPDLWYLPKSEYRLCDPPEVWRDVTEECAVTDDKWPPHSEYGQAIAKHYCVLYEPTHWVKNESYRLRKVQRCPHHAMPPADCIGSAFIIEQKVSE